MGISSDLMSPAWRDATCLAGGSECDRQASFADEQEDGMTQPPEGFVHHPVLVNEAVEFLAPRAGQIVVDCTVGLGGHSLAILPHLMPDGRLIAIDRDPDALGWAAKRLTEFRPRLEPVHDNFCHLPEILSRLQLSAIQGLIADLGLSSLQVDCPERGFSFLREGPLDMRMDPRQQTTAASLLRRLPENDLAHLISTYGEERWARRIARRIVAVRDARPIETTTDLARLVADAIPRYGRPSRIHPATRTFLALRLVVNQELSALETLLETLPTLLAPGGRAVLMTFHSLEDRLVKQAFRRGAQAGVFQLLTKKPLRPSQDEIAANPRARSAQLRAVERLP